jgi:hypothetical protein
MAIFAKKMTDMGEITLLDEKKPLLRNYWK